MKNILSLFLILVLPLTLIAQSNKVKQNKSPHSDSTAVVNGVDYAQYRTCNECGENWQDLKSYSEPTASSSSSRSNSTGSYAKSRMKGEADRTVGTFFNAIGDAISIGTMKMLTFLIH